MTNHEMIPSDSERHFVNALHALNNISMFPWAAMQIIEQQTVQYSYPRIHLPIIDTLLIEYYIESI